MSLSTYLEAMPKISLDEYGCNNKRGFITFDSIVGLQVMSP